MLLAGLEAMDLLGVGLILCNVFGQLLVANQSAEQFLASRDGLELNSDGVLCAIRPCRTPVEELVQRAGSAVLDREIVNKDAALSVPRAANKRPLTLLVRSVARSSKAVNSAQPAALVLILDSSLPVQTIVVELQQLYGLTSTEARLANLLMEGEALDNCCDRLGICRSTGCTHLKRIFKKTGVRRQSELVTLLLKSIGLARLGNAGLATKSLIEPSSLKQAPHKATVGRTSNAF
jgi:DNA-binding CsgD family transcriptional regulator